MNMNRRVFLSSAVKGVISGLIIPSVFVPQVLSSPDEAQEIDDTDKANLFKDYFYAYFIDVTKCIGCGMCVKACKEENNVPDGLFRTWIERYVISSEGEFDKEHPAGHVLIDSPNGGLDGFANSPDTVKTEKAFFVPKMCNHCQHTPCSQVCPIGATYVSDEGVVLVDQERCIGCGYCVQACPYGSRFINPKTRTADKCTWCYHRITKGLLPACVEACPRGVRQFGNLRDPNDPIRKILANEMVSVLKPGLLTKPKCYYKGIDQEVL